MVVKEIVKRVYKVVSLVRNIYRYPYAVTGSCAVALYYYVNPEVSNILKEWFKARYQRNYYIFGDVDIVTTFGPKELISRLPVEESYIKVGSIQIFDVFSSNGCAEIPVDIFCDNPKFIEIKGLYVRKLEEIIQILESYLENCEDTELKTKLMTDIYYIKRIERLCRG